MIVCESYVFRMHCGIVSMFWIVFYLLFLFFLFRFLFSVFFSVFFFFFVWFFFSGSVLLPVGWLMIRFVTVFFRKCVTSGFC